MVAVATGASELRTGESQAGELSQAELTALAARALKTEAAAGKPEGGAKAPSIPQLVLNEAIALSLADDDARLAALADRYGAMMAKDPLGPSFQLLTVGEGDKLYGSVTTRDIEEALGAQGFVVDRRRIVTDALKTLGTHPVQVRLAPSVSATIQFEVTAKA